MTLPLPPNIVQGQIALDPVNGIVYYKDENGNLVSTTWSWLRDDLSAISTDDQVTIDSDLTVAGNLVVEGDTVSLNVSQILVEDNYIILNSNYTTGSPVLDAGIQVTRGDENSVSIKWNEIENKWQFTNDGINFYDINSIIENSVTLGFHTSGEYVKLITAGTGVSVSMQSGEGSTPTISIGQDVSVSATPTFGRVIAPITGDLTGNVFGNVTGDVTGNVTGNVTGDLTGDVTGNVTGDLTGNVTGNVTGDLTGNVTGQVSDISNHELSDLSDVTIIDPANGEFLRYNGSQWINDPVDLTADTVGNYVGTVSTGLGLSVTQNIGEGATPNIYLNAVIDNLNDVTITSAANGQTLMFDGTNWVNTTQPTAEPMGHEDKTKSTISFNESTRQFTIAPLTGQTHTVWCKGIRYIKDSAETITISTDSGLHYIYYNSSGVLSEKNTFFELENDAPVAYVYWNNTDGKAYFFADERHGIVLDWQTHEYLHRTRGAAIASGFGANNYTLTGSGNLDSDAQIDIADGTFFDEDLEVNITHSSSPASNTWQQRLQSGAYIPVFYRVNTHWKKDTATQFPLKQGTSRPQYNLNTAGVWSTVDVTNNHFGVCWIIATNNLNEPIIAVLGQSSYGDKGSAEATFYDSMDLSGFPIVEFRPLYKIIYECKDTYTNTPKAALRTVTDIRTSMTTSGGISNTPVSDHGSMTGLQDDDHPQYVHTSINRDITATPNFKSGLISESVVSTKRLVLNGIEIESATPSDTNVLKYNAALNKYVPGVASTVATLDDLIDVAISSATPNQVIKFDGTNWVNADAPTGTTGTSYLTTIGDGVSSSFTITHGLSTRDVVVSFTETTAPYASFSTTWEATTLNSIKVYFETPPTTNSVRVSIFASVSGVAYPSLSGSMYSGIHGDGVNSTIAIYHGMGTRDVFLQVRNANSPYEAYNVAWESTGINTATIYFDSPPALNSIYVMAYAALSGVASTSLEGLTDTTFIDLANGDFLRYNGTNWINDPVNLSTDTVGDYVKNLVAGTGITILNNSGEGATPTISVTSNTYQPLDADLTAIAGLAGSSGLLKKTAADTWTLDTSAYITSLALNQLTDVNASTPSNDQVLAYDNATSKWVNKTFSASVATLDAVGDVVAPSPVNGEFLKWNGTAWINSNDVRDNNIRYLMDVN